MKRTMKTMTTMKKYAACLASVMLVTFAACSDDDVQGNQNNMDAAVEVDAAIQSDADIDAAVAIDAAPQPGTATDVSFNLESSSAFSIDLTAMIATPGTIDGHDLLVTKKSGVGPYIALGTGVTGVNVGHDAGFHDVDTAPATGYQDDSQTVLIGSSWIAGGSGATGFDVTGDVYVLHLADGTYAKVQVLSAKASVVHLMCYRQADGSTNVSTAQ